MRWLVIFFLAVTGIHSFAKGRSLEGGIRTDNPMECPVDPTDPFAIHAVMLKGKYAGLCINTRDTRLPRILSKEQAAAFYQPEELAKLAILGVNVNHADTLIITDFKHGNYTDAEGKLHPKFYVAEIPLERIVSAKYQDLKLVNGLIGDHVKVSHGQISFVLSDDGPPIVLTEQTNVLPRKSFIYNDHRLVITSRGPRPFGLEDMQYSPALAASKPGIYAVTTELGSSLPTIDWIVGAKLWAKEYDIIPSANADWTRAYFLTLLHLAGQRGINFPYTVVETCHNYIIQAMKILDGIDEYNGKLKRLAQSIVPITALRVLKYLRWGDRGVPLLNSCASTFGKFSFKPILEEI